MATVNLSFPWFFAAMCQNFIDDDPDTGYAGVFLYTTEENGVVYANMAATNMNWAVRIRWREEYNSGQVLHHIDNANHGVQLRFIKEHLAMMKGKYMQMDALSESGVLFSSVTSTGVVRVDVPYTDLSERSVGNRITEHFEDLFFSPTLEQWEARKLPMAMPIINMGVFKACDLKKYGFDKPLSREEARGDLTFAPRLFGLCRPSQVGTEGMTAQTSDGLHGLDFPEYPKDFKWYKDVSVQVVFMSMVPPREYM